MTNYQEEYNRKIRERMANEKQDRKAESTEEQAPQAAAPATGQSAPQAAVPQGSGTLDTAGNALTAAGAIPSPASPYLMAAGLGAKVVASGEANRRAEEEAQRQAYNDRIRRRQEAMAHIASMGIQ